MQQMNEKGQKGNTNIQASDEIDLGRLFATLFDFKWWVVGCTAGAAILGLAYGTLSTPVYQADALVQIESKSSSFPGLGELGEMFDQPSTAATEVEIIRSRMVLGSVVENLRLDISVTPNYFPIIGEWSARRYRGDEPNSAWLFTSYAWGGERLEFAELRLPNSLRGEALTLIAGERHAGETNSNNQTNFSLWLEDEKILDGISGENIDTQTPFGRVVMRVSDLHARANTEFTVSQRSTLRAINSLREVIAVSERGRQTGILDLKMTGTHRQKTQEALNAVANEYLMQNIRRNAAEIERSQEFIEAQIPRVQEELQLAENALNSYRMQNESVDIEFDTQRVLQQMVEIDRQLAELEVQEIELSRLYTTNHPSYRALNQQRERLQEDREVLRSEVGELPEAQQQVLRLTRDVEVSQQVYLQLLNRNQEMNILRAGTVGNVRIIDEATVAPNSVAPRKALILALSIILGGMIGVGIAFVLGFLRRGIETPKELEDVGISVYASVPLSEQQLKIEEKIKQSVRRSRNKAQKQKFNTLLLARDNPEDNAVEALRGLRTSLHFAMLEAKNKIVMISGPSPEVGKTFVTANLAVVLAQAGMKVLIIDADLRRGYLHTTFNLSNESGLSDLLAGRVNKESAINSTNVEHLDFMARGTVPPNPSELLMHKSFSELLDWANDNYDIVLVDTPPILAVTDPAIVGRYTGTNLIVARFMKNQVKEVEYTIERFEKSGIEVKGVILNGIERTARSSYGYGSYGYYSYGYESAK
ncbi:tyrosine-protein kinase [Aliidiomarina iranensis]|uniref:Tyrosine-protein kinase n=1 Tax=Aliidiomarina iranensis TaxID=1434071 RepID=A0A432VTM2_9GAMM|nr:polysaccharide biosynthesis tyrosine autokinase [Aliidiomarina iranensis]RUO19633.1 tyrosine-protein kinase [Aliidiomarina iranensis]